MAKLIYPINVSLDGNMEDEHGNIEWSISDACGSSCLVSAASEQER